MVYDAGIDIDMVAGQNIKRILLVEDSLAEAALLKKYLHKKSREAKVLHVGSISQAYKSCKMLEYDLIILDLNLPDSVGPNSVTEFKKFNKDTPIIVATGFLPDITFLASMKRGADHIYSKEQIFRGEADRTISEYIH